MPLYTDRSASVQSILDSAVDLSAGKGVFKVSSLTAAGAVTFDGDAVNNRVSAFQLDGSNLRASALQADAGLHRTSAFAGDAASLRSSAIQGDAGLLRASSFQGDASSLRSSAIQGDAGLHLVSGKQGDAALLRMSAIQGDGSVLRMSAILAPQTTQAQTMTRSLTVRQLATATTIKSSAGVLYGWELTNEAGAFTFLQFFNVSGSPTVGTDTPFLSFGIPATAGANNGPFTHGIGFGTGIVIAATTTVSGSVAPASGMTVNLFYI